MSRYLGLFFHDFEQHADSLIMPTLYRMQRLEGLGPCFDSA